MYNFDVKCNHSFDFLNIDHYLTWIGMHGDCKQGCQDKICEQKEVNVNGLIIKIKDFEVKK